jgi:hypothetical protein
MQSAHQKNILTARAALTYSTELNTAVHRHPLQLPSEESAVHGPWSEPSSPRSSYETPQNGGSNTSSLIEEKPVIK